MRVTNITIGRLANLGNYEHVRYEIAVEVKEGESAAQAIANLESILEAMAMRQPGHILSPASLKHHEALLADLREMPDIDVQTKHGMSKALAIAKAEKSIAKERAQLEAWTAMQESARARFDHLGGTEKFTDHKRDWDDDTTWED